MKTILTIIAVALVSVAAWAGPKLVQKPPKNTRPVVVVAGCPDGMDCGLKSPSTQRVNEVRAHNRQVRDEKIARFIAADKKKQEAEQARKTRDLKKVKRAQPRVASDAVTAAKAKVSSAKAAVYPFKAPVARQRPGDKKKHDDLLLKLKGEATKKAADLKKKKVK